MALNVKPSTQGAAAQGDLLGVDQAAEAGPGGADSGGGGVWRGQEGACQRPRQTGIPLYPEVS